MPRRKRTKSSDFNTYKLPAKKRITSSNADYSDASFGSQGKLYKVRNIIDENQSKYLIDWEDDPITGKKYTPTWEPKGYANAVAVADWNQKQKSDRRSKNTRGQSIAAPKVKSVKGQTSTESPARAVRYSRRHVVDSSSSPLKEIHKTQELDNQGQSEIASSQLSSSILPAAEEAEILVQISPHGSLERDQYICYLASLSQVTQSSRVERADSSIGESSPPAASSPLVVHDQAGTIPDSQSLPNSSSYKPTTVESTISSIATQTVGDVNTFIDPRLLHKYGSVSATPVTSSDSIEDGASPLAIPRRETRASSLLLKSSSSQESERILRKVRNSFAARQPPTVANTEAVYSFQGPVNSISPASARIGHDLDEVPHLESVSQGTTGLDRSDLPPVNDKRRVADRQPDLSGVSQFGNDTPELVFQTQIPYLVESQTSDLISGSPSSAGEVWQSGQIIGIVPAGSEQSSENPVEESPTLPGHSEPPISRLRDNSVSLSLGDGSSQTSQEFSARDSPHLSQRNLNSQSGKLLHSAQPKEDVVASVESSDLIVEELSSSIAPAAPALLLEVLESNLPQRIVTPSDMDISEEIRAPIGSALHDAPNRPPASPTAGQSLREKLKNMRAASAAESAARRANLEAARGSKSPSVIPEATSKDSVGDSRLEVRAVDIPLQQRVLRTGLHTPVNPSKLYLHKEMSQFQMENPLEVPKLGRMEYAIPLPLPARVKDQYIQLLEFYKQAIKRYQETDSPDEILVNTMQKLLHRLNNVTTHVDLDNDTTLTQQDVTPEMQVIWAIDSSAKFQFLQQFLNHLRGRDRHVVILAQGERLLGLLESFLQGLRMAYSRADTSATSATSSIQSPLQISLVAIGGVNAVAKLRPASVVIAFDASFGSRDAQIQQFKDYLSSAGRLAPIIHLLVYCSAEHIMKCVPPWISLPNRLRTIIDCVTKNSEEIGKILPEEHTPAAAAEEVAAFLEEGSPEKYWLLPPIRGIEIHSTSARFSQSNRTTSHSDTQPAVEDVETISGMVKRPLSTVESSATKQKRPRRSQAQDVTHVSDTIPQSTTSQIMQDLQSALHRAERNLATFKAASSARDENLQAQITDHANALSGLQTRYEDRNTEYHILRHERDDLVAAAAVADQKRDALITEIAKLKMERNSINEELKAAQEALLSSNTPEIAELEKLRAETTSLTQDKASLERRIHSMNETFEFTRQQYQRASTSAAEAVSRASELEAENHTLRQKASGEAVRLKQLNITNAIAAEQQENERLKMENDELKELLRKKERGRGVTTRTGSVAPKSPRLGGSPGRSRAGSRAPGSRPVSPVRSFLGVRKGRGPVD